MPLETIIVALVALFASGLTLFSGFGLGTVLMPVFAVLFPLPVAIAATAVVHLANNVFKLLLVGMPTGKSSFDSALRQVWLLYPVPMPSVSCPICL